MAYSLIIPKEYQPALSLRETQHAIKSIKDSFQQALAFALTLDRVTVDERPDEEIRDKILYAAAGPHGLTGSEPESTAPARDFVFYTPETPVAGLDEDFLSWWPGRYGETPPETLNCYALWNTEGGYGFFTDPDPLT